jgi:signal peptide peptidase SppA
MKLSPALHFLASHQWAIELDTFDKLVAILERHAAGERLTAEAVAAAIGRNPEATDAAEPVMQIQGDTAIVPMRGVLARYADSINGFCQARGRSAESVQADLIAAAEAGVNRIVLRMDSPGGEVSGTAETADLVAQLVGRGIEVVAYVDGMAASAAYWIASQASEIVASAPTALVGSIGVSTVIVERAGKDTGDKIHVITSAPAKSSPVLNEAQLANRKAIVMDLAGAFAQAVAAGRGLDEKATAKVATGEVWTAQAALALGLVDRIASLDAVLARRPSPAGAILAPAGRTPSASADSTPANEPAAPPGDPMKITALALAALIAAFPHHAAFVADRAQAGDEEQKIRDACTAKDREAEKQAREALQAKLDAEVKAHAETKEKLAAVQAKHDNLAKLAGGAPKDVGAGDPPAAGAKKQVKRADYDKAPAAFAADLAAGKIEITE